MIPGGWGRKLGHLAAVRGVSLRRAASRALTLPLEQRLASGRSRAPVAVTYEITHRCNLECRFCFLLPDQLNAGGDELEPRRALDLVAEIAELGAGLYVTGGEPLLRDDLADLVAAARRRGVRCGVNTNGLLLDGARGRALLAARPTYLLVSPHSLDAGTPTGRRERSAIRFALAARRDTRVILNLVLAGHPAARAGLPALLALARELGVDGVTLQHPTYFTATQRRAHAEAWTRATGEPDPGLEGPTSSPPPAPPAIDPRAAAPVPVWIKPDLDERERRAWYEDGAPIRARCTYPWTDLRLQPNGDVVFCQLIHRRIGNVRERRLRDLWHGDELAHLRSSLTRAGGSYPGCSRCCKLYRATSRR